MNDINCLTELLVTVKKSFTDKKEHERKLNIDLYRYSSGEKIRAFSNRMRFQCQHLFFLFILNRDWCLSLTKGKKYGNKYFLRRQMEANFT